MAVPPPPPRLVIEITSPTNEASVPAQPPNWSITVSGTLDAYKVNAVRVTVQPGAGPAWPSVQLPNGVTSWSLTGPVPLGLVTLSASAEGLTDEGEPLDIHDDEVITITATGDVISPELKIIAPANEEPFYGDGRITRVPVNVAAADRSSGLKTIEWSVDGTIQVTETFPSTTRQETWNGTKELSIAATSATSHIITVRCTDQVGNLPTERSVTVITPDITAPFYEIIEPKDGAIIPGTSTGATVTLKGTVEDRQSGVQKVEWALDGGGYTAILPSAGSQHWEAKVSISRPGPHTIAIRFTDNVGNQRADTLNLEVETYEPKNADDLVSVRAYLKDLLWFGGNHITTPTQPLTPLHLEQVFQQPFQKLGDDPQVAWGDQRVNQVRLCIEVLRKYLVLSALAFAALRQAESRYCQAAYEALLTRLGTSYEEMRFVRGADRETRSALAARLGIDLQPVAPDQLDQLRLQPQEITETKLEELFGLVSTTRDPWQSLGQPKLLTWQLEHLRTVWKQQDHRAQPSVEPGPPIIDPDLIGAEDLASPVAGNAAFDLWRVRATQMDDWLHELRAHREAEAKALDGFDRIVAETLGPVGHWKFDEGSGASAADASGNGIDGTLQGPIWSQGKVGTGALVFDGVDDYVQVGPVTKLALTNAGSIAAWIHPLGPGSPGSGGSIVNKESEYEVARFPDGTMQWAFANSDPGWRRINTQIVTPEKQWTHIVVVYDNGGVHTYMNGHLVHTYAGAGVIGDVNPALNDFRIGGRQGAAHYFQGFIDDVRVYNRALNGGEVTTLFRFAATDLLTLADASQQGHDIGPALKALHLSPAAFWRLLRIRELAKNDTVLEVEWQDVYDILVQVKKGQAATAWRQTERYQQIALTPEYFKISAAAQALPVWRARAQDRRAWQDTLQARLDQQQSVSQALQAAVQAVEEVTLPTLRDALVTATGTRAGLSDAADWLTDRLLIDVKSGGSIQTTRLGQAIETLQSVFFSLRTSRFASDHPAAAWKRITTETEADFDEEWALMGTHATWRAAMLVFFYPENSLLPSLRAAGDMTTEFMTLLDNVRTQAHRLTPKNTRELAKKYLDSLRTRLGSSLPEPLQAPFVLTEELTDAELKARGNLASKLFTDHGPQDYLKEIFYFVPIQLALQLQKAGHYIAALDWFQTVYAYNLPMSERKLYPVLALENADLPLDLSRQPHWLRQQLQPHALAASRPNPYTRYTLLSLVRCFLDFADAEFTRDTAESIANARSLYMTARSLLLLPDLKLPHPTNLGGIVLPNPVQEALRLRAETQLAKLHEGRNIAGMKRQVEIETRPQALRPTPYRYSVLIERSKQLVSLAQHMEAAYLAALEKIDVEGYNLRKAGYDLELAQAGVALQDLRVTEAQGGQRLAELQQDRVTIQQTTYQQWIDAGLTTHENEMLKNYQEINTARNWGARADAALTAAQAIFSAGVPLSLLAGPVVGALAGGRMLATFAANDAEQRLQENSLWASHERRVQEWTLQKSLADKDYDIAGQQITLAKNHVAVAQQEQAIAMMQTAHAAAMAEFLANKFTNIDLFEWMSEVLGGVYSYFLQQATAMARLAQNQLSFERQEITPSFIQADYWELPAETGTTGTTDGKTPDRRGLIGSARLLQDIYQLDLHAFETDKRKLNLSQTFSLARLAPVELQRFRDTGVLPFATPMQLFDQAFPGHYLRLIKRVRTSVVALIPPTQGIRATLMAAGISRTVVGGNVFQEVVLRHDPELVALTSPANATGVFELDAQPEMRLPFEGIGVDTVWEFHMPRAANAFDYRTIADVLLTIDYTALHSFEYRQQVIKRLDQKISAERSYSFCNQFPDEWWALHNPMQPGQAMTIRVKTLREDFPPNIEELKIQHVLLYFARTGGETFEVDVTNLQFTPAGGPAVAGSARTIDGTISTRRGNGTSWAGMIDKPPTGTWDLTLPASAQSLFTDEKIEDILFVITYSGRTPAWPV